MSEEKKRFTDLFIRNLKPKADRYDLREAEGFGIRIAASGKKSWIFFYHFGGRKRRMTLGEYPAMSLKKARGEHSKALDLLDRDIDPGEKKQNKKAEDRAALSVTDLVDEYLEMWAKPKKRSWKDDERQLKKDVVPLWGRRRARDIKRADVRHLLNSVVARGAPVGANRLLASVRRMFSWALEEDILEHSPCAGLRAPSKENTRDRVLSEEEIRLLWKNLDTAGMMESTRRALKFMLVTAQRGREVTEMTWEEVEGASWTIPAERAKNGQATRVPLSTLALELMGESGQGAVFPSPIKARPFLEEKGLSLALRRNMEHLGVKHFWPHDLRSTASTHMHGMKVPRVVVSKILNHKEQSVTGRHYDLYEYDIEKKQALDAWARKLRQIVEGKKPDNVVEIVRRDG